MIHGSAGIRYDTNLNHKTIPVFIWEVEEKSLPKGSGMEEPLLFIGGHQAVAYDDMVMAVSTFVPCVLPCLHRLKTDMR